MKLNLRRGDLLETVEDVSRFWRGKPHTVCKPGETFLPVRKDEVMIFIRAQRGTTEIQVAFLNGSYWSPRHNFAKI